MWNIFETPGKLDSMDVLSWLDRVSADAEFPVFDYHSQIGHRTFVVLFHLWEVNLCLDEKLWGIQWDEIDEEEIASILRNAGVVVNDMKWDTNQYEDKDGTLFDEDYLIVTITIPQAPYDSTARWEDLDDLLP